MGNKNSRPRRHREGKKQSIDTTRSISNLYAPLEDSRAKIRLFRIESANTGPSHTIGGRLEVVNLQDCPPFLALSYTWGSPSDQETIYVNDEPFNVCRNLFKFLRVYSALKVADLELMFRSPYSLIHSRIKLPLQGYIWIDQLCIDQRNVDERSHQVYLMSDIYKRAEQVLVWLGDGNPTPFSTIRIMQENPGSYQSQLGSVPIMNGLEHDPYWTRLWIVQELLLARDVTIMCGNAYLRWDRLEEWGEHNLTNSTLRVNSAYHTIGQFITRRKLRGDNTLDELLADFCSNKCMDPRDKVYGLWDLVRDEPFLERPRPNYKNTTVQVYAETVRVAAQTWVEISGPESRLYDDMGPAPPNRYVPVAPLQKLLNEMDIRVGDLPPLKGKNCESLDDYLYAVWLDEEARIGEKLRLREEVQRREMEEEMRRIEPNRASISE